MLSFFFSFSHLRSDDVAQKSRQEFINYVRYSQNLDWLKLGIEGENFYHTLKTMSAGLYAFRKFNLPDDSEHSDSKNVTVCDDFRNLICQIAMEGGDTDTYDDRIQQASH